MFSRKYYICFIRQSSQYPSNMLYDELTLAGPFRTPNRMASIWNVLHRIIWLVFGPCVRNPTLYALHRSIQNQKCWYSRAIDRDWLILESEQHPTQPKHSNKITFSIRMAFEVFVCFIFRNLPNNVDRFVWLFSYIWLQFVLCHYVHAAIEQRPTDNKPPQPHYVLCKMPSSAFDW